MKILVTGALGFVGSNLCAFFSREKGYEVVGIDNRFKMLGSGENYDLITDANVQYEYCDIRNQNDVDHLFRTHEKFDAVLHMAAQVAFKCSVENPRLDFEINALGTLNLLESVRNYCENATFIYASTNQVYGELNGEPLVEQERRFDFVNLRNGVPENYRLDFLSPYGCSKGAGDMYVQDYARVYGMNTVVARFGGIYGVGQYSYEDHGWISFISEMVMKDVAFNRFGHGKQVRDLLYISDIVNAINLMIENIGSVKGEAFNISGGPDNTLSVLELLDLLEELTGNKEKSIINPMRQADKVVMYLDISKAGSLLEWKPQVTKEHGVQMLLDWLASRS
jgi:CDP-paratose 2-epimerase